MSGNNSEKHPVRVRFAPSPTGTLHVGSARTALYNYLFARHHGGSFILRIEDTDVARSSHEHEQSVIADLAWLGLDWDEGPDRGGGFGPYRQSERLDIYREAAGRLLDDGMAYHCFCSQERLDELKASCLSRGEMPKYDRRCADLSREEAERRMAAGEAATIRFRVPAAKVEIDDIIHGLVSFDTGVIGDFIIIRSDGGASYNFAVVVDDAAMEITHVIRGEDHLTNTARQLLLFEALGEQPPRFAHHSLILGPDGGKLSKRHGATSVGDFRRMGYMPGAIINYLVLLSWSPASGKERLDKEEMEAEFDLGAVARSSAIFDIQKLNWLNGIYIRELDPGQLKQAIEPYITGWEPVAAPGQLAVAELAVQTSLATLAQAPEQLDDFYTFEPLGEYSEAAAVLADPQAAAVLDKLLSRMEEVPETAADEPMDAARAIAAARELVKSLKEECQKEDIPSKVMFQTLRISLTGKTSGPEVPFLLAGLGRDEARERLEAVRQYM